MSRKQVAKPTVYKAKVGARISDKDAQVIGTFCERLAKKGGGVVTAEAFVASASKDPAVSSYLEWDDAKAGHAHRLQQARELLRSFVVHIEREERSVEVRGMQFVDSAGGYVPAAKVFSDADQTAEVVAKAKREAVSWYHRYQHIRIFDDVAPVMDAIESTLIGSESGDKAAE